eukprot:scaffold183816_cov88-Cyclotella_meneghiniana.AAC.1
MSDDVPNSYNILWGNDALVRRIRAEMSTYAAEAQIMSKDTGHRGAEELLQKSAVLLQKTTVQK